MQDEPNGVNDATRASRVTANTVSGQVDRHRLSPISVMGYTFNRQDLSVGAVKQVQFALLAELASLLDSASEAVTRLKDEGLDTFPLAVDARPLFGWISETVEALDALGWRDQMDEDRKPPSDSEWSADDENENENQ